MNIEKVFKNPQFQSVWSFTFFHPCLLLYFLCDLDLFYILSGYFYVSLILVAVLQLICRPLLGLLRALKQVTQLNKWAKWEVNTKGEEGLPTSDFQLPRFPTLRFPLPTSHFRISFSAALTLAYFQKSEPNLRHNFKVKTVMGDRPHDL